MSVEFKIAFKNARKAAKLTQQQVADKLGISHPAVQQWESGKTHPSTENLIALSNILGSSILFWEGETLDEIDRRNATALPGYRVEPNAVPDTDPVYLPVRGAMPRDIEELGATVGGFGDDDSAFEMNGQVVDRVPRPPGLAHRKDVFALRVSNNSMWPKFKDGERVYVEKRKPTIGDDVVIELYPLEEGQPGKSFIKNLISRNSEQVVVEQYQPFGRLEFAAREVKQVFRVIPWQEVAGLA